MVGGGEADDGATPWLACAEATDEVGGGQVAEDVEEEVRKERRPCLVGGSPVAGRHGSSHRVYLRTCTFMTCLDWIPQRWSQRYR